MPGSSVDLGTVANLSDNRKTVTTAGTAVALVASATPCAWVSVIALPTNTQQVNVGSSSVLAASGTQRGVPLLAGDSVTLPVNDVSKVFVDSRVNGEGVSFLAGA